MADPAEPERLDALETRLRRAWLAHATPAEAAEAKAAAIAEGERLAAARRPQAPTGNVRDMTPAERAAFERIHNIRR